MSLMGVLIICGLKYREELTANKKNVSDRYFPLKWLLLVSRKCTERFSHTLMKTSRVRLNIAKIGEGVRLRQESLFTLHWYSVNYR